MVSLREEILSFLNGKSEESAFVRESELISAMSINGYSKKEIGIALEELTKERVRTKEKGSSYTKLEPIIVRYDTMGCEYAEVHDHVECYFGLYEVIKYSQVCSECGSRFLIDDTVIGEVVSCIFVSEHSVCRSCVAE